MRRSGGKNPYPGVTRTVDRHGKVRWRFRQAGKPGTYLPGAYGSAEFRAAYEAAVAGGPIGLQSERHGYGTIDWLIEYYKRSPKWQKLGEVSRRNLAYEFQRLSQFSMTSGGTRFGKRHFATLRTEHIESIMAKFADRPAAANALMKLFRRLARFAIRKRLITVDPTIGIERYEGNADGFHTWTEDEIEKFEKRFGVDSQAVLALRLILYTGAAREDVIRLGWQSINVGRIAYRRLKTGGEVDLPIADELADVLEPLPTDRLLFLTRSKGRAHTPESFGYWFRQKCHTAKLPHCSSHGLRKAGATRLGNAGATELEIMAFLGHKTPNEARTYVKKANRARLADSGAEKLARAKTEHRLSNRVVRLDSHRHNALKGKEKF